MGSSLMDILLYTRNTTLDVHSNQAGREYDQAMACGQVSRTQPALTGGDCLLHIEFARTAGSASTGGCL